MTNNVRNLCLHEVEETERFTKTKSPKGVYVWGYQVDRSFIPLYVGKSRNIFERIIQHYCRFSGGEYIIPNTVFFDKAPTADYSIDISKCFIPTDLASIYSMLNNPTNTFQKNKQHIISNFKFTYLKIDDKDGKAKREIAEKYLSNKIGKERLISSVPLLDTMPDYELMNLIDTAFSKYYKPA